MSEKYSAKMTPVPAISGGAVVWGWKAELTDNYDEKVYPFEEPSVYTSSDEALQAGTKSLRELVRAYDLVAVYQVDLYSPDPAPEEKPEEPKEPEVEENPEKPGEPEEGTATE